ncbi:DUF6169 family protein [Bacteroides helcogenes]|nr:DUF6169 family protein [Bacteroides helcogenes]
MADVNIFNENAYQFAFTEVSDKRSDMDLKVVRTLLAIIEAFFCDNRNIMLFICYDMDNSGGAHSRLFQFWYQKYNRLSRYYMNNNTINIEGFYFYTAMVCRIDHPDFENKVDEYESYIKALE